MLHEASYKFEAIHESSSFHLVKSILKLMNLVWNVLSKQSSHFLKSTWIQGSNMTIFQFSHLQMSILIR